MTWWRDDGVMYASESAADVPGAPTGVTATAGNARARGLVGARLRWRQPDHRLHRHRSPGARRAPRAGPSAAPCADSTNGTPYTFTVTATNAAGTGPASAPRPRSRRPTVPGAPTGVTATAGNAQAARGLDRAGLRWRQPPSPATPPPRARRGPDCTTSGALSCTVAGLTNGTPYTFTVTATNAAGTGPASAPSAPVTPATVPGAPTGVSATAGNAQASCPGRRPPPTAARPITGYTATTLAGGQDVHRRAATSDCTVSGLTNGTPYTFTVTATNAAGTGPASTPSASVTPRPCPAPPPA